MPLQPDDGAAAPDAPPHATAQPLTSAPQAVAEMAVPRTRRRRRLVRAALLALGPLVVAVAALYAYGAGGGTVGTDNAYVKADKVALTAEVEGRIDAVLVEDNQHVEAGQPLFRLDPEPYRIALARAEAEQDTVRTELQGLAAQYAQQAAELELARLDEGFAQREYDRQATLAKSNVVSAAKLDAVHHDLDAARERIAVVTQGMAALAAQLGGDPAAPVENHPRYREAAAARDRAALDLARATVVAPFAGIVGNTPRRGAYVEVGTAAMSLVADHDLWIEANMKETDLTFVTPGQPVSIRVDTYPGHAWTGTVTSISQSTGAEFSVLPPQNATGNWVKVVQRVPVRIAVASGAGDPPLRAGLSAVVDIETGHRRELPAVLARALAWAEGITAASAAEAGARP